MEEKVSSPGAERPNYIDKVGLEIEGGWKGEPGVNPFTDAFLIADHSVNGQTLGREAPIEAPHIGEVVSEPIPYADGKWREWLLSHWPNADPPHRTNRTCGYHIHLSVFSKKAYTLLSSKVFLFQLQSEITRLGVEKKLPKKHIFWERVNGANTFCTLTFNANRQMEVVEKRGINRARYGWLNFAAGIHGTMEFRALPTFRDAEVALFFSERYFEFVNTYLAGVMDTPLQLSKEDF